MLLEVSLSDPLIQASGYPSGDDTVDDRETEEDSMKKGAGGRLETTRVCVKNKVLISFY